MSFDDLPTDLRAYHARTRHAPQRYALGPAFLDWESQPDPFRRFDGAPLVPLPLRLDAPTPPFADLAGTPPQPLDADALGLFLELAFGLSAWKDDGHNRWPLRNNPSSGNLHPTEAWLVLPPLAEVSDAPALCHYAPREHGLELRCRLAAAPAELPDGAFLLALSSVLWREAWKYGERAFRYCQHDVGHALAAASYAAACLGWHLTVLATPGDGTLAELLGLDREDAGHRFEREHPDLIAVVSPHPLAEPQLRPVEGTWFGRANRLSADHDPWPAVDRAAIFTRRAEGAGLAGRADPLPARPLPAAGREATAAIIRRRRSAQRMKKGAGISRDAFFRILAATLPAAGAVPARAFPWAPRLALVVFVHCVDGLAPGIYALPRDPAAVADLRATLNPAFDWRPVADCPIPLVALAEGEIRAATSGLSCLQAIAGNGAFSLAMLADFDRTLAEAGAWAWRRLHWEAGLIGQILYLEATAAGVSGTGIGCFFDDDVLAFLGAAPEAARWRSLYHFTVGVALDDPRIATLPAYAHLTPADFA